MVAGAALVLLAAPPAGAVVVPAPEGAKPAAGTPTQMQMSGLGPGAPVRGFIADPSNSFDPVTEGYPSRNPTSGFSRLNESFAGIIHGTSTDGSETRLSLYCADLNTETYVGINYALGTWDESNVPNVNYVAQVLRNYYPQTVKPVLLLRLSHKAAAVQAAIWFFSNRYVLNTRDPLHDTVADIVAAVIDQGPAPPPTLPSLNITPRVLSAAGTIVGPFTVTATGPATSAHVSAFGGDMFSDAAATRPIPPGAAVPSGTQIWLRQTKLHAAVLHAAADATVPSDNVYLYDGTNAVRDAQRLILAQDATLHTTVNATALFIHTGSIIVQKTITGPAAGRQGAVTINVRCGDKGGVLVGDPFDIPAGTTGTSSKRYDHLPSGSTCTVTEIHDGHTDTVTVDVEGSGQTVVVGAGTTRTATITDTYGFVASGALVVKKSIAGPGAGQQGDVVIQPTCGGTDLEPFTIAGGTTGEPRKAYTGLAPGTVCTINETVDGHTSTVSVTVTGDGQEVTVPVNRAVDAEVVDTYDLVPGSLTVTKTIAGAAAGEQGDVTISVSCNEEGTDTPLPDFTVPAGTAVGSTSRTYPDIPAGSICTATETGTGDTSSVRTTITGDNGTDVPIPAGGTARADITDTYSFLPAQLVVRKSITGPGAGRQGAITIEPSCDGNALPPFEIPAGAPAGISEKAYGNIPATATTTCTITETADGGNTAVSVAVTGGGTVSVAAGDVVTSTVTDDYTLKPGSLVVNKTITGAGAGQQGQITIKVTCVANGQTTALQPDFVIAPGTTGTPTHTYRDIAGDSVCTVLETEDGHNATVTVLKARSGSQHVIPPGGTATANLSDTYLTGELVVNKTIIGDAAGSQAEVTIHTVCNGVALTPDLVVPAGSAAGTYPQSYPDVIGGATCTVTETADGDTGTVTVRTTGSPQDVTLSASGTGTATITDDYAFVPGSLTVSKTIAGDSAGGQGAVVIHVDCGPLASTPDFTIAAGVTGSESTTYADIPAGTVCTVAETADGSTAAIAVTTTGSPQDVTIPAAGTATAAITDTYGAAPGALTVTKTIDGSAAGSQGAVTIHTVCDGTAPTPDFVIPAGTAAGQTSHTYPDVPAGSACTVTETADGSSNTVRVITVGDPQNETVPAGGVAEAELVDVYRSRPGSLTVSKTIDGPSAGEQGAVTIGTDCGGLTLPEFTIPAGRTGSLSHTYEDVPAGLTCTITEEADGSTGAVGVVTTGSPQQVTIDPAGAATAELTDTYAPAPGTLKVQKTIDGASAGSQGPITIVVECAGTALPSWTIPAGTAATTLTHTYADIPAGTSCTVTETEDGATTTVFAAVAGANQTVTVPGGITASVSITDTFSPAAGAADTIKTLAGPAAGEQGSVGILLDCGGSIQVFAFVIPERHPGGPVSQVFNGVGGASQCRADEVVDGHTSDVGVHAEDASQVVTVPAAGLATVGMTDDFSAQASDRPPPDDTGVPANGPGVAATGPPVAVAPLVTYALAALLAGVGLLAVTRRPGRRGGTAAHGPGRHRR